MDIVHNISQSWTIGKYTCKHDCTVQHLNNMCTCNGQYNGRIIASIVGINEVFGGAVECKLRHVDRDSKCYPWPCLLLDIGSLI